tara:strand:- start:574 stop:711 length:138 start_codon:yes stop_codon:yes gene_type:complete
MLGTLGEESKAQLTKHSIACGLLEEKSLGLLANQGLYSSTIEIKI